jgi:hypothetical protein
LRQHAGASQTRIGIAVGMPQSQVSVIMSTGRRRRQVTTLDVFVRIADGLGMPDGARRRLGIAAVIEPSGSDAGVDSVPLTGITAGAGRMEDAGTDPVRRRDLFELAGVVLVGAAIGPAEPRTDQLDAFAEALIRYPALRPQTRVLRNRASLSTAVAAAKRAYQACRYAVVATELPALLIAIQDTIACAVGDERYRLQALSADAHHVAASVLLKLDDHGLACLAADRSMQAAELSQDPLALGSSTRILTHTLMSGGHLKRATQLAGGMAARMDAAVGDADADSVSVYGALLLRGAIAAAHNEDRTGALAMADEAEQAANRLGADGNHYGTAFGPTNVLLHQVNIAATLGDAGTAIDYARRVEIDRIPITERRAALYIDVARAFNQWGRYAQAYHAIRHAETIASEEIRSRPAVHRLVADLVTHAPPSLRAEVHRYADRIGVRG